MAVRATVDEVHRVISAAVDPAFYRAAYPELDAPGLDPVRHYATAGWREGRDPAPWFSTRAYLVANTDVRRSGLAPLYHYLTIGHREGREVQPSPEGQAFLVARLRRGDPAHWRFDPAAAPEPMVPQVQEPSRVDALPASLSATDVAIATEIDIEIETATETAPDTETAAVPAPTAAASSHEHELVGSEFDAAFYLDAYPDVAAAAIDPLEHFVMQGWREGRDPSQRFSVKDYLETYPDVAAAGLNPFFHYLLAGRAEGRSPRNQLGFRYQTLAALAPVSQRTAAIKAARPVRLGTEADLAAALAVSRTRLADLHITFSHDDYSTNIGGVQICLQREDARVAELGRDHLHLYPVKPWPVVRTGREAGQLGVLWNGRRVGAFAPKTVVSALAAAAGARRARKRSFAIHSLLGHTAGETAEIVEAAGLKAGYFWLHDFASLCAGFHLLRNDVEDCAAPPPDSAACRICAYLPMRARHLAEHEKLFERLDLTVVSPSQPTLDLWRASWRYPHKGEVLLPHATLVERGPAPVARKPRPLRLAYAGLPFAHKGWPIFKGLALQYGGDPRYQFLHLGLHPVPGLPIEFHPVAASEANPRLMQETLEALQVDAVLIWPLCRETFSFIAYEAVAAGCAVITGPDSGNVQAFVQEGGHGWVLPDEDAIGRAMASGDVTSLSRAKRRPKLYDLKFSDLTVDLLRPRGGA